VLTREVVKGDRVSDVVPALESSRRELDAIDASLVHLLARRSQVILDVIRYKKANSMPVVDRDREDRMLSAIEQVAVSEDLDPRIARQVLRSVIDAFTLLEVEELGSDPS
jgi:chorismate mutase